MDFPKYSYGFIPAKVSIMRMQAGVRRFDSRAQYGPVDHGPKAKWEQKAVDSYMYLEPWLTQLQNSLS